MLWHVSLPVCSADHTIRKASHISSDEEKNRKKNENMFSLENPGMISKPGDAGSWERVGIAAIGVHQLERKIQEHCVRRALEGAEGALGGRAQESWDQVPRPLPACFVTLGRSLSLSESHSFLYNERVGPSVLPSLPPQGIYPHPSLPSDP